MIKFAIVFGFFLLVGIVIARFNTAYHGNLIFKRYIEIKNKKLARLLIWGGDPSTSGQDNAPENTNKILWLGVVFYLLLLAVTVCSMILIIFVPRIEIEPQMIFESVSFSVKTLNEKISVLLLLELDFAEVVFLCLNITRCETTLGITRSKILRGLWIGTIVFLFACLVATPFVFWFNW